MVEANIMWSEDTYKLIEYILREAILSHTGKWRKNAFRRVTVVSDPNKVTIIVGDIPDILVIKILKKEQW